MAATTPTVYEDNSHHTFKIEFVATRRVFPADSRQSLTLPRDQRYNSENSPAESSDLSQGMLHYPSPEQGVQTAFDGADPTSTVCHSQLSPDTNSPPVNQTQLTAVLDDRATTIPAPYTSSGPQNSNMPALPSSLLGHVPEFLHTDLDVMDIDFSLWPGYDIGWPSLHEDILFQNDSWAIATDAGHTAVSAPGREREVGNGEPIVPNPRVAPGRGLEKEAVISMSGVDANATETSLLSNYDISVNFDDLSSGAASLLPPNDENQRQSLRNHIVGILVKFAMAGKIPVKRPRSGQDRFWRTISGDMEEAFQPQSSRVLPDHSETYLLKYYVNLCYQHFHPLWPLFGPTPPDFDSFHPMLYLTLSSIGATCHEHEEQQFGLLLHQRVREALMSSLFDLDDPEDELVAQGQSILTTQVATLYLGDKSALAYAQHLGCMLVNQARRMNLFASMHHRHSGCHTQNKGFTDLNNPLRSCAHAEARKRLAFGILRIDVLVSILADTKPLISPEEINLELPCFDAAWLNKFEQVKAFSQNAAPTTHTASKKYLYSDLVQIAIDQDEALPALQPIEYELVLCGLQYSVWRFCHDPDLFIRLTGVDGSSDFNIETEDEMFAPPQHTSAEAGQDNASKNFDCSGETDDLLDFSRRKMNVLRSEKHRILFALRKWKQSLFSQGRAVESPRERGATLGSLLLYHLSFIRLYAPMDDLLSIALHLDDDDDEHYDDKKLLVDRATVWSKKPQADATLRHACAIWSLVNKELKRSLDCRAMFNLLTLASLHRSAIVVWAYAGTHNNDSSLAVSPDTITRQPSPVLLLENLRICRENTRALISNFATLIERVSFSKGIWPSFYPIARRLADFPFPL
ncbi:MAG: hypothetical protein M1834_002529 [Cirrosporium novae-zelandiae]|nr:MAG: hypothetical protein M1834_002529 [Cirrosporium novae-zelandiae]